MAVREILLLGNPVLRSKCSKVKHFSGGVNESTITDLSDTLSAFRSGRGFGRGIAAPQIGVVQRIIFIDVDGPLAMINPEIVRRSRRMMTLWDDCFSFPELLVKVRRHVSISVKYQDVHGHRHRLEATGGLSELLQHELDHLDGVLALDRAIDTKHIVLRSEWNKLTKGPEGKVSL